MSSIYFPGDDNWCYQHHCDIEFIYIQKWIIYNINDKIIANYVLLNKTDCRGGKEKMLFVTSMSYAKPLQDD